MDRRALLLGPLPALVLVGCGAAALPEQASGDDAPLPSSTLATDSPSAPAPETPITVPLSLYLMQDAADAAGSSLSSQRSEDGLTLIGQNMGEVWAQANVIFDPITVATIAAPTDVLEAIALGLDTSRFFDQIGATFDVPDPSAVNGFYVRTAGRSMALRRSGPECFS